MSTNIKTFNCLNTFVGK